MEIAQNPGQKPNAAGGGVTPCFCDSLKRYSSEENSFARVDEVFGKWVLICDWPVQSMLI